MKKNNKKMKIKQFRLINNNKMLTFTKIYKKKIINYKVIFLYISILK